MNNIVYGIHAIKSIIDLHPKYITEIYISRNLTDKRIKSILLLLKSLNISTTIVSKKYLDVKTKGARHQGILAKIKPIKHKYSLKDLSKFLMQSSEPFLILVLDKITDPHNLGACMRCACAAGANAVIVSNNQSAKLNATVRKTASGAAEVIPLIRVTNLVQALNLMKKNKIWIIGTVIKSNYNIYQTKLEKSVAIIIGSEQKGISKLVKNNCDELVSIPTRNKIISSLNVSVAAGIFLFEAIRQRNNI